MEDAAYVSGFVDGEGSFLVSFQMRSKMATGVEVRPSFTISQHQRNRQILDWIQRYFGCGSIRFNKRDQTFKYEVRSLDDLLLKVAPHFKQYPLKTSKSKDFESFKNICKLMKEGQHLSRDGIVKIFDLAYGMNNLGARRYDKRSLLQMVSKLKV